MKNETTRAETTRDETAREHIRNAIMMLGGISGVTPDTPGVAEVRDRLAKALTAIEQGNP